MKADIRKGIGCLYIVIRAESESERTLLGMASERRNWSIESITSMPIFGQLQTTEISLVQQTPSEVGK